MEKGQSCVIFIRCAVTRYNTAGRVTGQRMVVRRPPPGESRTATGSNGLHAGLESPLRKYDSNLGRFDRPDPLGLRAVVMGDPGSWNRFAYVGGDPVNFRDPKGLFSEPTAEECINNPELPGCRNKCALSAIGLLSMPEEECEGPAPGPGPGPGPGPVPPTRQPLPKFLQVTNDCYRVPSNGGAVTREISYELADDSNPPEFYRNAVIWEHLTGDLPLCGANCPSSGAPGHFDDQQSVLNFTGVTTMHTVQTSSAKLASGQDVSLFVRGFGQDYGVLDIVKTQNVIYINGNAGGKVDPQTGKLVKGTYKECD